MKLTDKDKLEKIQFILSRHAVTCESPDLTLAKKISDVLKDKIEYLLVVQGCDDSSSFTFESDESRVELDVSAALRNPKIHKVVISKK